MIKEKKTCSGFYIVRSSFLPKGYHHVTVFLLGCLMLGERDLRLLEDASYTGQCPTLIFQIDISRIYLLLSLP